ncbi:unnamed protein product [Owenia fusiformis]|uniref:Uncharacterized protein n=1 Tax=Owenia fusiformis TaxID=6347 RepID=A0A8S4Q6S3_OWEFU|nr:unnamed protein product [Owenia fusiformis]
MKQGERCPPETLTDFERFPTTKNGLLQHSKRAILQATYIWGQSATKDPKVPSPVDWGWVKQDDIWCPLWRAFSQTAYISQMLVRYSCSKSNCATNCSCRKKAKFHCTELCVCKGLCGNSETGL